MTTLTFYIGRLLQFIIALIFASLLFFYSSSFSLALSPQERLRDLATMHFKLAYFGEDSISGRIHENYPIVRWSDPVRISLSATTDSYPTFSAPFLELLDIVREAGHDIVISPLVRDSSSNARIIFADAGGTPDTIDLDWLSNLPSGYIPEVKRLWKVFSRRKSCAMGGGFIRNYEVAYYLAFMQVDATVEKQTFCGYRLLIGLLGFQGGRTIAGRSIFTDNFAQMHISELDKIVLRMLADSRMTKGMLYNTETDDVIQAIAADIVSQLDANAILQLVDSGK